MFNELREIKNPRVTHSCVWCYGKIKIHESHQQYVGMYEGDFQDWRVHSECLIPMKQSWKDYDNYEICSDGHKRGGLCQH